MSANIWSSRADVLHDLKEVTGGTAGLSDLDDYVAVGEMPPPDRRESIDEDEMQYHFGVLGSGVNRQTGPDLQGISQMLQMVKEDSSFDNEPKTIFRSTINDEFSISKLNPNVNEFVPSNYKYKRQQPQLKPRTPEKNKLKSPTNLKPKNEESSKVNNGIKLLNESNCDNKKEENQEETVTPSHLSRLNEAKVSARNSKSSLSKDIVSSNDISFDKKVDISNMKSNELEDMKKKIKSMVVDAPVDSKRNRQKNVAISALLRIYAAAPAPAEKPVKLITPDYFESPPVEAKKEVDVKDLAGPVEVLEETPSTSTSSIPAVYKDPFVEESISKVNDWFKNAECPKPKPEPLPVPPVAAPVVPAPVPLAPSQFRDALSFKKKNTSTVSVTSKKSEASSEKKKPAAGFVPSSYASDLLQKYENNAKSQAAPKEDWRAALDRQLQEKDEEIRRKRREKLEQSPSSMSG